ncbi:MAG: DNA (cytosine-5-)-methyltransferase [Nitrosarchaeum sp.]|jgi:DNA (cytosine-5)-methyltransferase 1|uniref:DNA cytosine methyltransferase n=1 Tax=Nitrosarchaeum sp. TaxID=2026886 RepID=UPI002DE4DE6E|nr:DNA (cytosine-5-)-methyltransferase [Nitrosarchaeum sp.]MEC4849006.1 DNA (cytosine-5-)-methyltransferase [Nitrosarchaeum sp.]
MEYTITEKKRSEYRRISNKSREAKKAALSGKGPKPVHPINTPKLNPEKLMPQLPTNGLRALSLFSGCGGLDLGFDRAGFTHVASYDIIPICGETILNNKPNWKVFFGNESGDVRKVDWSQYKNKVDVVHGGPPCQPFSINGQQKGTDDERNMWPQFIDAVNKIKPRAFVAENVPGMMSPKFSKFIQDDIISPLKDYKITLLNLNAAHFGVPQNRKRVVFIGFQKESDARNFVEPAPTHTPDHLMKKKQQTYSKEKLSKTMGIRESLGLSNIGIDSLAPTVRSGFTGKRNTTSILNGSSGQKFWSNLQIWPSGVAEDREKAKLFVPDNKHFRLSVQDCAIMQGFPNSWKFKGAVYQILGQIGNSVAPPVAYVVAKAVANTLKKD